MVTAAVGGAVYNNAAVLAELVNKQDRGVILQCLPGGGVSNPPALGAGEADLGWIYPVHAAACVAGTDPYGDKAYPDLRTVIGGFSQQYCHFATLADSGVTDVKEALTSGKPVRILTNVQSTMTGWMFTKILEFYGLTPADIEKNGGVVLYTTYSDWPSLAQDGHIDLIFEHSTVPTSALREIQTTRDIVILPTPQEVIDFVKETYSYIDVEIPANTYNNQTEAVKTMGTKNMIATNVNVPDEAITALLDILLENEQEVRAIHPSWEGWSVAEGWKNLGAPLHPAAEKWYKDHGYMK